MKKILSIVIAAILMISVTAPAFAEGIQPDAELKQQLYKWAVQDETEPPPQDTFVYEDVTGDDAAEDYRIYHVYSTDWTFSDEIGQVRLGNRILTFSNSDRGYVVYRIVEDDEVYAGQIMNTLEEAYDWKIINDAALDKFAASAAKVQSNLIGDVDANGKIEVSDVLTLKAQIMGIDGQIGDSVSAVFDINDDGKVNVSDIIALKNIIMGQ